MADDLPTPPAPGEPHYHGFWPVLLIGLSFLLVFAWEIRVGVATRQTARQLQQEQVLKADQAKEVQARLEKLVRSLVELSKTDEEAKRIVTQFGVKVMDPTGPTSKPAP